MSSVCLFFLSTRLMILKPFQSWPLPYADDVNLQTAQAWRGKGWGWEGAGGSIVSQWFIAAAAHIRTSQAQTAGWHGRLVPELQHQPLWRQSHPLPRWKVSSNLRQAIRILKSLIEKVMKASPAHYTSASAPYSEITRGMSKESHTTSLVGN